MSKPKYAPSSRQGRQARWVGLLIGASAIVAVAYQASRGTFPASELATSSGATPVISSGLPTQPPCGTEGIPAAGDCRGEVLVATPQEADSTSEGTTNYIPLLAIQPAVSDTVEGNSRGYLTTPQELASIAQKAAQAIEPYQSALQQLLKYAGPPSRWPHGTISGQQDCEGTMEPVYVGAGAPLIFAKALAYQLTGDDAYATDIPARLLDLVDTYGYGGEVYSGANQCILNLSWYLPSWIMAADLIEDYPGWTTADKRSFQRWLADEVYKKTAWASRNRVSNWGAAGSATSGMIADYLWDSPNTLQGATPAAAYAEHRQQQFNRMNIGWQGDSRCPHWGIQWYGGIPDELRRGSSGCEAQWIVEQDASWSYTQVHLEGTVMHAEFLLRRGDASLYTNIQPDGSGSILRAIHFVLANPINPNQSTDWGDAHKGTLEVSYRYYRDAPTAAQLRVGEPDRFIGRQSGQLLHFGTITHGFAPGEDPGLPPTVPPPGP